ncbi:MAG: hypothetical protein A2033_03345 [Bacteroidetes bacterium GWA2_31_9]|nr:MAG: hypothetical protein A2033_03345 [Bacteroidetes bacterium GWA2_31_9]
MQRDKHIEKAFPKISHNYKITSPIDNKYNCIAFAAGDNSKYWWPAKFYWPDEITATEDLNSFIACFKLLGYAKCEMNSDFEPGYEKVAIYIDPDGKPTHAAKQFADGNGLWKSKLGSYKDIEHTLDGLSGWSSYGSYGHIAIILKRKVSD